MISKFKQLILGDNNTAAGRDIIINYNNNPYTFRFFEDDIKEVILCFSEELENLKDVIGEATDFNRPDIEKKNEINRLSEDYFEHIKKHSINYFEKIKKFLSNPSNEEYLNKYLNTANELNNKIRCHRKDFIHFEKVFDIIYTYITEKNNNNLKFDKNLIWVFLHFMYYNCDIGEKNA